MRRRVVLVLVVALVLAVATWWSTREEVVVEPPTRPADTVELEVTSVIDGDTLRAVPREDVEPWLEGRGTRVRLLVVDAPERETEEAPGECFAAEATTRLTELLPPGSRVYAQLDQEPTDQYDRMLAYLWNEEGVFVNLAMVQEGFATAVLFEPNDRYYDEVKRAEGVAGSEGRGLWGVCR